MSHSLGEEGERRGGMGPLGVDWGFPVVNLRSPPSAAPQERLQEQEELRQRLETAENTQGDTEQRLRQAQVRAPTPKSRSFHPKSSLCASIYLSPTYNSRLQLLCSQVFVLCLKLYFSVPKSSLSDAKPSYIAALLPNSCCLPRTLLISPSNSCPHPRSCWSCRHRSTWQPPVPTGSSTGRSWRWGPWGSVSGEGSGACVGYVGSVRGGGRCAVVYYSFIFDVGSAVGAH